jgi:hypothetical protein
VIFKHEYKYQTKTKEKMNLYELLKTKVKKWLESKGFQTLITGDSREFVIPIADLYSEVIKFQIQ